MHNTTIETRTRTVVKQVNDEEVLLGQILDLYPAGIVSVVMDTFDLWHALTHVLPFHKEKIMARDGKLVIRPDSGDPVDILTGKNSRTLKSIHSGTKTDPEDKGVVELLWETFGGTVNDKGFKELDSHIGVIYGDSINYERAQQIIARLAAKGFASTNVVFGVGSYCVHPDTLILCDDLIWRKAGELKPGQGIISFTETPEFGNDKRAVRTYEHATIEENTAGVKKSVAISTAKGDIQTSHDHPFLVYAENRRAADVFINGSVPEGYNIKDMPRGPGLLWKNAEDLEEGDQIAFFGKPWQVDTSFEGGWLSGIFDGEGHLSKSSDTERIAAWKVGVAQNEGVVLSQIRNQLDSRGYSYYINDRKDNKQVILSGGWRKVLRILGEVRPSRLMLKFKNMLEQMPALKKNSTYELAEVTKVESVGNAPIASIRTSNGTFITNGFLSHNTYQYNTRDTFMSAIKATWAEIDGKGVNLKKDPATDSGTKKSATGRLAVLREENGDLFLAQEAPPILEDMSVIQPIWENGEFLTRQTFEEVRNVLNS